MWTYLDFPTEIQEREIRPRLHIFDRLRLRATCKGLLRADPDIQIPQWFRAAVPWDNLYILRFVYARLLEDRFFLRLPARVVSVEFHGLKENRPMIRFHFEDEDGDRFDVRYAASSNAEWEYHYYKYKEPVRFNGRFPVKAITPDLTYVLDAMNKARSRRLGIMT
jgi:hypothetical protein